MNCFNGDDVLSPLYYTAGVEVSFRKTSTVASRAYEFGSITSVNYQLFVTICRGEYCFAPYLLRNAICCPYCHIPQFFINCVMLGIKPWMPYFFGIQLCNGNQLQKLMSLFPVEYINNTPVLQNFQICHWLNPGLLLTKPRFIIDPVICPLATIFVVQDSLLSISRQTDTFRFTLGSVPAYQLGFMLHNHFDHLAPNRFFWLAICHQF